MKLIKLKWLAGLLMLVIAGLYYYITLPAINIHASGFWFFIIGLLVIFLVGYIIRKKYSMFEVKKSKMVKAIGIVLILVIAIYLIGALLSSSIINAK